MKASNTYGVQFIIRAAKNPELPHIIYARITVNGLKAEISLKRNILAEHWNID